MQNLLKIQDTLKTASEQQLMGLLQNPNPSIPQWAVVSQMNTNKEMLDEQTRQQGLGQSTILEKQLETPQVNVAGMPQDAASNMGQNIAPKTDTDQNTGIASVAPVATMASGGILKMAPGGAVNQVIVTFAEDSPIYPGETRRMTQDTLEAMPRNSVQDVKGVADVGGVEAAKKVPYLPMSGGLKRQLKTIESESFSLIDTSDRNNVPPDNYGVSANLPPAGGAMYSSPTGGQGSNTDSSRLGLPKDEFSQVPVSSMSTPVGLATLAAAGDADVRGETPVVNTSTLSEKELRKQADNRNEAGRARFELMKALEATNSKGQPGGTLGKRYAESGDDLRMVDAQRYIESLIKGDPYSGELSPSQTARNQKTLSDTLRREEMQRQRDAIERQGMESQEEIARKNARGDALAALGEIDRSSEPALFRQIASIAGERQANALRADPAMFGDMPFNATSDEAAKKSVSQATLANIDRDKRVAKGSDDLTIPAQLRADEPGTELAVAAKTDPMQMTDTEIRNASQGLIPYDMSMAADGAQDPKPTAEPNLKTTTQDTKLSPAALEEYISRVNSKGQPGGTVLTLEQQMENAKAAIATEAENDPSILDKGIAAVSNLKDSVVNNATREGGIVDASTEFYDQFIKGKGPEQVVADRNYAYMDAARNNPDTFAPEIVKDKPLTLGDILIAASGDKSEGVLTSAAKKVDDLAETLETDGVQSLPIVKNATAAGSELVDSIISGAETASDFVTTNVGPVTGLIFDTINPGTKVPEPVLKAIESGYDAATGLFTNNAKETATAAGVVLPTPAKIGDAYKEYGATRTASNLAEAKRKQDAGGSGKNKPTGIATVNPMANRASDSPSSYEQKLLDILAEREKSADQDKWLGLAEMGMRLMASSNPNALAAIGEAGLGASQTFLGNKRKAEAQEMDVLSKLSALEARKQIADDANRTRLEAASISRSGRSPVGMVTNKTRLSETAKQIKAVQASLDGYRGSNLSSTQAQEKSKLEDQLKILNAEYTSLYNNQGSILGTALAEANTPAAVNLSK